ncbi:MAG TPA: helix-turn-helix domain-containing protein [Candidatus Stackebrandtia excrementipullorum]|nr:helix-turn-helix domain-containing protein [Candidatus Stackebrandtia excrementipullorum]
MQDRPLATDAEAKALASSLRIRILRLCLDDSRTNKQIAQRLGMNPATVLHHVRKLVATGFLEAEPERIGPHGAREIPYRATRKSYRTRLEPGTLSMPMLEAFNAEFPRQHHETTYMARIGVRLSDTEYSELRNRVRALFDEYADRPPSDDSTAKPYSLFAAIHLDEGRAEPDGD